MPLISFWIRRSAGDRGRLRRRKSTLLRLMAGLFSAQHGRILLDNDEGERAAAGVAGMATESEDILFNASVLQNITLFDPWYSDSDRGRVEALVEKMALGPVVQALPGGWRR